MSLLHNAPSACGLMGVKVGVCLVSSSIVLLNPENVCREQMARCLYSRLQVVFSVSGHCWDLRGTFGPIQMIVPDLELGKTLSLRRAHGDKRKTHYSVITH